MIYLISFLLLTSCKREFINKLAYPECLKTTIQEILANPPHTPRSNIKKFIIQGEYLYAIKLNAAIVDEGTLVVNERCETVCLIGGIGGNLGDNCLENATYVQTVWTDPR